MSHSIKTLTPEQCSDISAGLGFAPLNTALRPVIWVGTGVVMALEAVHLAMTGHDAINRYYDRYLVGCSEIDPKDYVTKWACGK